MGKTGEVATTPTKRSGNKTPKREAGRTSRKATGTPGSRKKKNSDAQIAESLVDSPTDAQEAKLYHDALQRYRVSLYKRQARLVTDYRGRCLNRKVALQERFLARYAEYLTAKKDELLKRQAETIKRRVLRKRRAALLKGLPEQEANAIAAAALAEMRSNGAAMDIEFSDSEIMEEPAAERAVREQQDQEARERVWLQIVRRHIPKVVKQMSQSTLSKQSNGKKVALLCQREIRRVQARQQRYAKEHQIRAKRLMKEMLLFWKRNEREERESRKRAEKEALEKLKQEEEMREARRQARKLNFLITQTELYSHFVGKKIGVVDENDVPSQADASQAVLFGHIDFDNEDDDVLRQRAEQAAQQALALANERTRLFDQSTSKLRDGGDVKKTSPTTPTAAEKHITMDSSSLDEMNFQNPSSMKDEIDIQQPKMLTCQLKNYQLKGLNWLANLYEQGINGILADEMGLGKTVQSISVMAYLAEVQDIWGPFLVIAPASTLHNWQQEIARFTPELKIMPYWGSQKDRRVLRQFWNQKSLYRRDAAFHVLITSYQLVVQDEQYFRRLKWQYMILDEAQAIKSSSSARWKTLLSFNCRNRLLLTGTPIQNSMQELWALLHFIMPSLFDSHEEFSEWFSKDIESHAENKSSLNEHQLKRLHMILKPFMLRRVKKHVQHELGDKIELEVKCQLTHRQKMLYRAVRDKISIAELLEKALSTNESENIDNLMNLVMQFRKVCNHPELFERADVASPFCCVEYARTANITRIPNVLSVRVTSRSPIKFRIPKRLYRDGGMLSIPGPATRAGFLNRLLLNDLNIWQAAYVSENIDGKDAAFAFTRFGSIPISRVVSAFHATTLVKWIELLADQQFGVKNCALSWLRLGSGQISGSLRLPCSLAPHDLIYPWHSSALDCMTHLVDRLVSGTILPRITKIAVSKVSLVSVVPVQLY